MFEITINGRTFKIKFQHLHETKRTICTILNTGNNTILEGVSRFNEKDNPRKYSKWLGKVLSLVKALKLSDFSEDEFKEVMQEFHRNFPRKPRR